MDFLAKHYEKLILAFCLLLLLGGITGVALSASSTSQKLAEDKQTAKRSVEGGNLIEEVSTSTYNIERYFNDPRKICAFTGEKTAQTDKGSMLESNKMIICVNEDCHHMLLLSTDECPFCKTKQPELSKSAGVDEDTDEDGIPDIEEQKYSCLDYRDPRDATLDADNDGFLNIEEIKYGTAPDDPEDYPPLAALLRVQQIMFQPLNIELVDIERDRKAPNDQSKWEIAFKVFDQKTRKMKRTAVRLNDKLQGKYDVTKAGFDGDGESAIAFATIVSEDGDEYRIEVGKTATYKKPTVRFFYLKTRNKIEFTRNRNRMFVQAMVGKEFSLVKPSGSSNMQMDDMYSDNRRGGNNRRREENAQQKEYYKLIEADPDTKTCKVALLDGEGGTAVKTLEVSLFDDKNEKDFLPEDSRGGDMFGEMPPDDMMRDGRNSTRPPRQGAPRKR